jgi:RNA polymerase sigma-70 factor (ECF subfamily)
MEALREKDMHTAETLIESGRSSRYGALRESARKLDAVVVRYLPTFYKRAFRYLGNASDAEDAVQEALLSAYRHWGQFRGQAKISTWLTAIVNNAARMQLRQRRAIHVSLDQPSGEDGLALSERLPDSKPSPEDACFASEAHGRLLRGANQLSPTLRRTFQLRCIDGLTTRETACLLGVPEGTVKARLARARAKIDQIVQPGPRRRAMQGWPSAVSENARRRIIDD